MRTGMAAIVVQFGLATMPFGIRSSASGLTSTPRAARPGPSGAPDELSITIAPAAVKRGASCAGLVAPAENRAMSRRETSAVAASSTTTSPPRHGSVRPAERGGRHEVADLSDRELPLVEQGAHHHRPGRWHPTPTRTDAGMGDEATGGSATAPGAFPVRSRRRRAADDRSSRGAPRPGSPATTAAIGATVADRGARRGARCATASRRWRMGENRPWPEAVRLPSETGQRPRAQSRGTGEDARHRPDHGSGRHEGEILDDPRAEVQRCARRVARAPRPWSATALRRVSSAGT